MILTLCSDYYYLFHLLLTPAVSSDAVCVSSSPRTQRTWLLACLWIHPSLLRRKQFIASQAIRPCPRGYVAMNYNPLHLLPLPPTALDPKPIPTSLTLDPFSDVLWVGTSSGIISALCSPLTLTRNVHFPAHGCKAGGGGFSAQGVSAVRGVRVTDRDVWTLTEGGIGGRKRGGAPKWTVRCALHWRA